ncbi:hypothetical protein Pr1d_00860 [Bythopirellula goksoeyrii]|uniref:Uncharacterized protein n=1 Tax=Bythopirellula goksoeyrii TaxID=1400387 RepID=A0A5B9Q7H9_9BACT|nr:hypothetical protein Pr1d_00860 [Bythopirellula goksoeyrii]
MLEKGDENCHPIVYAESLNPTVIEEEIERR